MKKLLMLLVMASVMPLASMAQDDDVYFTPSKSSREIEKAEQPASYAASRLSVPAGKPVFRPSVNLRTQLSA